MPRKLRDGTGFEVLWGLVAQAVISADGVDRILQLFIWHSVIRVQFVLVHQYERTVADVHGMLV